HRADARGNVEGVFDHLRGLRRVTIPNSGSLPPSLASRRALSRSIGSLEFFLSPVAARALAISSSSSVSVTRMLRPQIAPRNECDIFVVSLVGEPHNEGQCDVQAPHIRTTEAAYRLSDPASPDP